MNIGIIGAENSHAAAMARHLNVEKLCRGFRVTHLWGETKAFARRTAEAGEIPNIVADPAEMLGQVDGVMIDHRDGKHHVPAARPFVMARVPVFIDKPLCTSLAQARRFLAFRKQCRCPVMTTSSIPRTRSAAAMRREIGKLGDLRAVHVTGPGDWKSKYGGIWFYGIHEADLLVELLGPRRPRGGQRAVEPRRVATLTNGRECTAVLAFDEGLTVTLDWATHGCRGWWVQAVGAKGSVEGPIDRTPADEPVVARLLAKMVRTGTEPFDDARMLAPLAILEGVARSLQRKAEVAGPKGE